MDKLIELLQSNFNEDTWPDKSRESFEMLFGSSTGRYPNKSISNLQFRTPAIKQGSGVPFSAMIHSSNPSSGGYSGLSFVIFPVAPEDGERAWPMIAMVTGTQGLAPDAQILAKPGHSRKLNAICKLINEEYGEGEIIAWAKSDATRIDKNIPLNVKSAFQSYHSIFERYGNEIYGFAAGKPQNLKEILSLFLDFHFEERGYQPLSKFQPEFATNQSHYLQYVMPKWTEAQVADLLEYRQFVILQGPPGTGKTRMATRLLTDHYENQGKIIQFHPNISYENFIGGLSPNTSDKDIGLQFQVKPGSLLEAVEISQNGQKTLLIIDEINRADLSKVLGEAIFCFEPGEQRSIDLAYDFGGSIGKKLSIPPNLHILGTMNTADRSISGIDIAIRRRFAFLDFWPQMEVILAHDNEYLTQKYRELLTLFIEYGNDDSFALMPGHSYFLEQDGISPTDQLKINLVPLLNEYIAQGYVSNFAEELEYYLQSL